MISTAILYLIYMFILTITYPLRLFSDVQANANITSAVTTASGYVSGLNEFLPATSLLTILGILITYEVILATYKVIKWVYIKIPFVN